MEIAKPVERFALMIEDVFKTHAGVDGFSVYNCTNYMDVRLMKLLNYIMENKITIPSNVYGELGEATKEFLDYVEANDMQYFLPRSGWYDLKTSMDNMRFIQKWLATQGAGN